MAMNRRQLLKLGASSVLAAFVSPTVFGQANKATSIVTDVNLGSQATKVDGLISYNAGWVIELEDKASLLEVEARKTREKEELDKQKAGNTAAKTGEPTDKAKSVSGKFQEFLGKVKSFF